MGAGRFATVINCMDGRVQEPVSHWIKARFGVDYVDTITEPGPDKLLSEQDQAVCESIRKRLAISVNKHGSRIVAVVAHHDCAGNPVDQPTHMQHLATALDVIASWKPGARLVGLWVDADWQPHLVAERQA